MHEALQAQRNGDPNHVITRNYMSHKVLLAQKKSKQQKAKNQ
jgi:hypothetical protein